MESRFHDYSAIDGVNIVHAGHTAISLARFGDRLPALIWRRLDEGFGGDLQKLRLGWDEVGDGGTSGYLPAE